MSNTDTGRARVGPVYRGARRSCRVLAMILPTRGRLVVGREAVPEGATDQTSIDLASLKARGPGAQGGCLVVAEFVVDGGGLVPAGGGAGGIVHCEKRLAV